MKTKNKILKTLMLFLLLLNSISYAQTICNSSGNLLIYSNNEGGNIGINVDVNIPNLYIGICSYENVLVTISGTFSNNVVGVTYVGYNAMNNHCGLGTLTPTVIGLPPTVNIYGFGSTFNASGNITYFPNHGNGNAPNIVGAGGDCDTLIYQGGANTPDEVVYYFLQQYPSSTLRYHHTQYNCWNNTFNVSDGGNCCILPAAPCSAPSNPSNVTAAANLTICAGNSTTLSASSTATVNWYASNSSTVVLATGANFPTPNLATGTYTYYAGAVNGCGNSATKTPITINVNATPTITSSSANSTTICSGQSYTIGVLSGGTGNYTLTNTGATSGSQFVVTPTANITYTVIGVNGSGCISSSSSDLNVSITVNASPTLSASSVSNNTICSGQTVTFTPSGGAVSYTLVSNNSYTDTSSPYTDTPSTTSDYTLTGIGANGCISSLSSQQFMTTVFVNASPTVATTGATSATLCSGESFTIGTLSGGGTGSYTLTNDGTTSTTNFVVTPSITTIYTVIGANSNGCISTSGANLNVTLTVNSTPTVSANFSSNALCSAQNVTITMSGATNGYTLNPGNSTYAGSTATAVVTPTTGTTIYTITATNLNGCVSLLSTQFYTTSVSVLTNPTITASAITNSICAGNTASITPFGATTYTLEPGGVVIPNGSTYTMNIVTPTTYTINGTATGGCFSIPSTQFVTIIGINANPTITAVSALSSTICTGLTTTLTAGGATSYTWSGGPNTPDYVVSPNSTTVYTVTGTNAVGCTNNSAPTTLTVNVLSSPTLALLTTISTNTLCSGNSATITLGGASAGSTYTLFPSLSVSTTSFVINPTTTTDYTVVAIDNINGCLSSTSNQMFTTTVNVSASPTIALSSVSPSATLCSGQSVTITPTGGVVGSYTLTNTGSNIEPFVVTPSVTTTYTITGTSSNGCISTASSSDLITTITVNQTPTITVTSQQDVLCFGGATGSVTLTSAAGGTITYTLTNSTTTNVTGLFAGLTAGNYTVIASDINGCLSSLQNFMIIEPSNPLTITELLLQPSCANQNTGSSEITITGGTPNYTVLWSNGTTNYLITNQPQGAITATVTDANNCIDFYNAVITSSICVTLNIPNFFTPGSDGKNDLFIITGIEQFPNNKLEIYNRWGNLVYSKTQYDNTFNGKANQPSIGNGMLPASSYFYVFDLGDGITKPFKGYLELKY